MFFINYLNTGIQCTFNKFDDDTKLRGAVEFLEGREANISLTPGPHLPSFSPSSPSKLDDSIVKVWELSSWFVSVLRFPLNWRFRLSGLNLLPFYCDRFYPSRQALFSLMKIAQQFIPMKFTISSARKKRNKQGDTLWNTLPALFVRWWIIKEIFSR